MEIFHLVIKIFGMFEVFIASLISQISLDSPTLLQGTGVIIVTIYLSVILFIYTASKSEMQIWDRIVILEKVANIREFGFFMGTLVISPIFWGPNPLINFIILLISLVAIFKLSLHLLNLYNWIMDIGEDVVGYRQRLREEYLTEHLGTKKVARIWAQTWSEPEISAEIEQRMIKRFFEDILKLVESNRWKEVAEFLNFFNLHKEKRNSGDFRNTEVILRALFSIHYKNFKARETQENDYVRCTNALRELISYYLESSLSDHLSFILFDQILPEHVKHKDDIYASEFIKYIAEDLFEKIPKSRERYDIWKHYFPKEWKCKIETLKENLIARSFFNAYLKWVWQRKHSGKKEEFDHTLDEITRELLPEVSPSWWAEILSYIMNPLDAENPELSLINNPPKFGRDRIIELDVEWEKEDFQEDLESRTVSISRNEKKNAAEMALLYIKSDRLSLGNLEKIHRSLRKREKEYEEENILRRIKHLLDIFKKMKEIYENLAFKQNKK